MTRSLSSLRHLKPVYTTLLDFYEDRIGYKEASLAVELYFRQILLSGCHFDGNILNDIGV